MSHKSHTAAGQVEPNDVLQFWVAFRCCLPEVVTELLQAPDVDAWAKDRRLTLNDAVPAWVIRGAEEIRRLGRAAKLKRCPPDPPVAGVYSLRLAATLNEPDWRFIEVKTRVEFDPFWQGDQLTREKKKILREFKNRLDAAFERINRRFQSHWRYQEHFEWAVRFQVGREHIKDIAAGPPRVEERTVRAAVKAVCRLLQITQRRDRVGRPRKQVE